MSNWRNIAESEKNPVETKEKTYKSTKTLNFHIDFIFPTCQDHIYIPISIYLGQFYPIN
jgi:hypothetical protein